MLPQITKQTTTQILKIQLLQVQLFLALLVLSNIAELPSNRRLRINVNIPFYSILCTVKLLQNVSLYKVLTKKSYFQQELKDKKTNNSTMRWTLLANVMPITI